MRKFSLALLLLLSSTLGAQILAPFFTGANQCCTYYSDSVSGSDSNAGTKAAPFANVPGMTNCASNCAAVTLAPGQSVGLKAGSVWRQALTPAQSGSSGSPITYAAYGTGNSPVITAANLKTWTQGSGNPAQDCANGTQIFCSGFETGGATFTDWGGGVTNNTNATVTQSTAVVNNGTHSMLLTNTSGTDTRAFVTSSNFTAILTGGTFGLRFYINPSATPVDANGNFFFSNFYTASANPMGCQMFGGASGVINAIKCFDFTDGTNVIPQTSITLTPNTWNQIEIDFTASATVGTGAAIINGTTVVSTTGLNTVALIGITHFNLGNNSFGALQSGATIYFDDVRVQSTVPIGSFNSGGNYPATVWRASQATNPYILNFGANAPCTSTPSSCLGIPVSSLGAVTAANDWYWDGSTYLYVYGPGAPTSTVEVPTRNNAVVQTGKSFLAFNGITFRGGLSYNVLLTGQTSGSVFNNDIFELSYYDGWYLLENSAALTGINLLNSTFRYNGASGMQINASLWTGFVIAGNQAYRNTQVPGSQTDHNFSAGLHAFSATGTGGAGSVFSGNTIYQNGIGAVPTPTLAGEGNGIHIDTCTGVTVSSNTLFDNFQSDILLEKDINSKAIFNTLTSSITHFNFTGGIEIEADSGNHATGNLVAQNTLYGTFWWNIALNSEDSSTGSVLNNTVQDNLSVSTSASQALYVDSPSWNSGANGNVFGYSGFGPQYTCMAVFAGSCVATYSALDTAYGSTMHNITADPLFVSPPSNLNLQGGSPAIGAGVYIPGVSTANPPNIGAK